MLDALVMTLGFEPGPLVSAIASAATEGFQEKARIVVFTSAFPDERARRAWLELQRIVTMLEFSKKLGIQLQLHEINVSDFSEAVSSIREKLLPLRDKEVRISITGGMRVLCLALFTAYLLIDWLKEPKLNIYLEGRGMAAEVPPIHRLLAPRLTETQMQILVSMTLGAHYTSSDIAGMLRRDRTTIYKSLQGLREMGLVEREGNFYKLTKLGSVFSRSTIVGSVEG